MGPSERRHRDAAVARPRPRPPRRPAASAEADAAALQGRQSQALALPRRVLGRGHGLCRTRWGRPRLADLLGGLGPREWGAHRAHRDAPSRAPAARSGPRTGPAIRSRTRRTTARSCGSRPLIPRPAACAGSSGPARGAWAESVCPNGEEGFVWTRKRVVEVDVDVRVGERRIRCTARGVEDESAGYHPRHTVWSWSAGVGTLTDGREVGWNFVEGVNDPPERSERAIWVDGEPFEPGPSAFRGLEAVSFEDGSGLEFQCRGRALANGEARPDLVFLPPALRDVRGDASGRPGARERHGRDGEPRRDLVSAVGGDGSPASPYRFQSTCQRHGGSSAAGKSTWFRPARVSRGTRRGLAGLEERRHRVVRNIRGRRRATNALPAERGAVEPVVDRRPCRRFGAGRRPRRRRSRAGSMR